MKTSAKGSLCPKCGWPVAGHSHAEAEECLHIPIQDLERRPGRTRPVRFGRKAFLILLTLGWGLWAVGDPSSYLIGGFETKSECEAAGKAHRLRLLSLGWVEDNLFDDRRGLGSKLELRERVAVNIERVAISIRLLCLPSGVKP